MINAIIMASGFSRRMGRNKLMLLYNSKPLIDNVMDHIIGSGLKSVFLVSGNEEILERGRLRNIKTIYNGSADAGQSESIKAGILNSPVCDGYMFFAGDQPLLDEETIRLLADRFEENKDLIIIPVFKGRKGSPVIFPKRFKEELLALSGDTGGREVIKNHPGSVLLVEVKDNSMLLDIDTKEAYMELIELQHAREDIVVVRGGGDIATGTIHKLYKCGFKVLVLETANPTAIRRSVSFCESVYDGSAVVEGVTAKLVRSQSEISLCWEEGTIPVAVDPQGELIRILKPLAVVDAILAKKNLGTERSMAPITIGLGPGFTAGIDVDIVIETMRGHSLGRLIFEGSALPNTGIPGEIAGHSGDRVIHSPDSGVIQNAAEIGDTVSKGSVIAWVGGSAVKATIDGILRGIIRNNSMVSSGMKIADIDPRLSERPNCFFISEKARNIAGGVLEAILYLQNKEDKLCLQ
jgi:molybdenum cofactor cytidylyltransferase